MHKWGQDVYIYKCLWENGYESNILPFCFRHLADRHLIIKWSHGHKWDSVLQQNSVGVIVLRFTTDDVAKWLSQMTLTSEWTNYVDKWFDSLFVNWFWHMIVKHYVTFDLTNDFDALFWQKVSQIIWHTCWQVRFTKYVDNLFDKLFRHMFLTNGGTCVSPVNAITTKARLNINEVRWR